MTASSAMFHAECRAVLEAAPAMLRHLDSRQRCVWSNRAWLSFCGRTAQEERGLGWAANVHPADLSGVLSTLIGATGKRRSVNLRYRLRHVDGEYCWVEERGGALWRQRRFVGHVFVCNPVAKPTQEELTRQLELERLSHAEFAHRVKNTLQLIVSALRIEARQDGDQSTRLRQAASRIHAIVTVQDRLEALQSNGSVNINLLVTDIAVTVLGIQSKLALHCDIPDKPIRIPTSRAATIGMIVSEAIMNSIKHATGRGATVVRLSIKHRESKLYIEVSDDGPGFPQKALKMQATRSLGLSLIKSMAAQANAQLWLLNREGAVVRLMLSVEHPEG